MQKAIFSHYGGLDTIQFVEVEQPTLAYDEVLLKVEAVGLNPKDILVRKGKFKRLSGRKFPQGIGFECMGTIVDANGFDFQEGRRMFGMINGWRGRCCAEYVNISKNELFTAPPDSSVEELAGISLAGQTALQSLRDIGQLQPGQRVCINGASGGVGTLAIQIAKILGGEVTTISSTKNIDYCRSFGADHTLAYDSDDIHQARQTFDLFFDVFGNYSFATTSSMLTKYGRYVTTVPKPAIFREQIFNAFRRKKARMIIVKSNAVDLHWLGKHMAEGSLRAVVDKVFPMADLAEAQAYIESKRAKGKVIVKW